MDSKENAQNTTEPKKYFFREQDGTITYCDTQEELFAIFCSPKGYNFKDMGRTDYLELLLQSSDDS